MKKYIFLLSYVYTVSYIYSFCLLILVGYVAVWVFISRMAVGLLLVSSKISNSSGSRYTEVYICVYICVYVCECVYMWG